MYYYYLEEMAQQREREIARRTRSPLFTHHPANEPVRSRRDERGGVRLSLGGWWRRGARRQDATCRRAAAWSGTC
jgi:hypothetical protein